MKQQLGWPRKKKIINKNGVKKAAPKRGENTDFHGIILVSNTSELEKLEVGLKMTRFGEKYFFAVCLGLPK